MPRAARHSPLRVVAPDEAAPAPEAPLSVSEAAEAGDHYRLLCAMRTRVALEVESLSCPARDLAALTRRLQELAREIEAIDAKRLQEAREDVTADDEEWDSEAL